MLDFLRDGKFSVGSSALEPDRYRIELLKSEGGSTNWSFRFRVFKLMFDYGCAVISLPLILLTTIVLFCLNPWFNLVPLFFSQVRMGRYGEPFRMWKFRTMSCADPAHRSAEDGLEEHRITKLGRILRKTRIDELPNFFNVMSGAMSVVGPRPDAYHHASAFGLSLPGYKERHRVTPGITGLAQVEMGYAEGSEQTALKAVYDNIYAARACGRMELYIIARTFTVIFARQGR